MEYIKAEKSDGCVLCEKPAAKDDIADYILYRGKYNYVMLNAYPYNPGHLMVVPYRHTDDPAALPAEELHEHSDILVRCLGDLRKAVGCQGFNLGMNLGLLAGAGIADHIHSHIVPRWNGDSNFLPVIAETKSLPEALAETYDKLIPFFAAWKD